jgi:hypothetical protein
LPKKVKYINIFFKVVVEKLVIFKAFYCGSLSQKVLYCRKSNTTTFVNLYVPGFSLIDQILKMALYMLKGAETVSNKMAALWTLFSENCHIMYFLVIDEMIKEIKNLRKFGSLIQK